MVLLQYDYTNAGCTAMNKSSTFMVHVGALDYGYNLHGEVVSFISENVPAHTVALLRRRNGAVAATYDDAPFGAVTETVPADSAVPANPFQWSSEVYDSELDLVYYNYRHYSPSDGRWLSRDPIEEAGGQNLYGFVGNAPTAGIDILGFYVVLCFAANERTIVGVYSVEDGEKKEFPGVVSGNNDGTNNPDMQHVPDVGMVPIGRYWIGNPINRHPGWPGDWTWYPLYGDDGKGGKSQNYIPVKDPKTGEIVHRGGFYIHTGRASNGCVTIWSDVATGVSGYPKSKLYDELKKYIDASKGFENPRKRGDCFKGVLIVVKCKKTARQN
ncbi:MAG: RHS repeat-associated core domain-containing protein [Candidatus Spyradosoma sp.]